MNRYPLIFYVKSLPAAYAGVANGPIIRILESHKDDVGIYIHELCHVRQWFLTISLHSLLYLISDGYKLWAEVQAYKIQATYYSDDRLPLFARFISNRYNLAITEDAALRLLHSVK